MAQQGTAQPSTAQHSTASPIYAKHTCANIPTVTPADTEQLNEYSQRIGGIATQSTTATARRHSKVQFGDGKKLESASAPDAPVAACGSSSFRLKMECTLCMLCQRAEAVLVSVVHSLS